MRGSTGQSSPLSMLTVPHHIRGVGKSSLALQFTRSLFEEGCDRILDGSPQCDAPWKLSSPPDLGFHTKTCIFDDELTTFEVLDPADEMQWM